MRSPSPARLVVLWVSAALFAVLQPLAGQSSRAAESKAVAAFEKAALDAGRASPAERKEAVAALGSLDSKAVAEALAEVHAAVEEEILGHEQARLLAAAEQRELLAGQEHAAQRVLPKDKMERFNELRAELDQLRSLVDELRDLQGAVRRRFEQLQSEDARDYVLAKVLGNRKSTLHLRLAAARVVASGGAESVEPLLKALRRAKPVTERIALIDALAAIGEGAAEACDPLVELLEDDEEVVRERAALALSHLRQPRAVLPLIDLLERETGMVRKRIAGALEVLTRQAHGDSVGAWRAWYAAEGAALTEGQLGGGRPSAAKAFDKDNYYFGLPQDGKGILYVIDASGSMEKPVVLKTGGTSSGGGAETSRLEACKAELIRALGLLPPTTRFNVVWYNDLAHIWADGMKPAQPKAVAEAQDWVRKLTHASTTNIHDALQLAFTQVGRGVHDRYYGVELDTIFLLTDGSPTKVDSTPDSTDKILAAVAEWNPLKRVVIHTIGIGGELNAPFLQALADQNGGEFKRY